MPLEYITCKRVSLREAGFSESWLQSLVQRNPTILGLGDLKSAGREVRQSAGGRLDFLFINPDSEVMYEVELMLGPTDESHIIRTLEYWDIETRRWPTREHRAVIVAEEITQRFFNVIWLLNRSIPIIALKMDTLLIDGKATINFTKVLDIYETPESEDSTQSETTRGEWAEYANRESMEVLDGLIEILKQANKEPKVTYNSSHIALGGPKRNFAWFFPTKQRRLCRFQLMVGESRVQDVTRSLNAVGVTTSPLETNYVTLLLGLQDLNTKRAPIEQALMIGAAIGGFV